VQHSGLRQGEVLGQQRPDMRCSPRPRCRRAPARGSDSKAQRRRTEDRVPDSQNICRSKSPARPSAHDGKTVGGRRRRGRAPWSPRRAPGTLPPAVNASPPPSPAPAHRLHMSSTVSRRIRPCTHGPSNTDTHKSAWRTNTPTLTHSLTRTPHTKVAWTNARAGARPAQVASARRCSETRTPCRACGARQSRRGVA
jgi:hypothetical protein